MSQPKPTIQIVCINPEKNGDIPHFRYMTPHASGMDISAAIDEDWVLLPGKTLLVPTGFAISIPQGFEGQIRPRSGLAIKHGITIVNTPGTIDSDYRGEVKVALINLSGTPYTLRRGNRIAQMVIHRVYRARLERVEMLDETQRSEGGFGHTGI